MLKNTLIALAATAMMATATAGAASAKTNINLDIGLGLFGGGGYVDPYPSYPVADDGWDDGDCYYKIVTYKKWNASHTKFKIKKKQVMVCS
ncbi:MAG: hypothetical protein ACKVP5_13950 [Aestuariivirga sp.]